MVKQLLRSLITLSLWLWFVAVKALAGLALKHVQRLLDDKSRPQGSLQDSSDPDSYLVLNSSRRSSSSSSSASSDAGSLATVKLRLRGSLKKRKEQVILFNSCPSTPGQLSPCGPLSPRSVSPLLPVQPVQPTSPRKRPLRPRTNSEMAEIDDKVMPLPIIKTKHRKWKSCSSMHTSSSSSNSVSLRRFASRPALLLPQPHQQADLAMHQAFRRGGASPEDAGSSSQRRLRVRYPSADEIMDGKRRRDLMLVRRQGRQLSDPSGYNKRLLLKKANSLENLALPDSPSSSASSSISSSSSSGSIGRTGSSKGGGICRVGSAGSLSSLCMDGRTTTVVSSRNGAEVVKTYCIVNREQGKFLVEQQVVKSAQRGP